MIKIEKLNKSFGKTKAIDDFSYLFDTGVYGILGPNGAGKTTLLRCMANLYKYESGNISFFNENSNNLIGYLPQKFGLFPHLTVIEMMKYFSIEKNIPIKEIDREIEKCLDLVGLSDKSNKMISTLSGGMIRRLGVAQAIIGNPSVIIFDEPTTGLDPEERIRFKNIISSLNFSTVILSTHIVSDVAEVCDKVIIMDKGKIKFSGKTFEIRNMADKKVFAVPESRKNEINGEYVIQSKFEHDGKTFIKVLTGKEQCFSQLSPTLEDGYVCCLRNI